MSSMILTYLTRHLNQRDVGRSLVPTAERGMRRAADVDASASVRTQRLENQLDNAVRAYHELRYELPDAFIEVDIATGRIQFLNRVARALLGYTEADLRRGLFVTDVLDHGTEQSASSAVPNQMGGRPLLYYTVDAFRKDGTRFRAEIRGALVRNEAGRPFQIRAVFRDLSARSAMMHEPAPELAALAALVEPSAAA